MTDRDMGGPAFPGEQGIHGPHGDWNETFHRGMTLWDFYAANASDEDIEAFSPVSDMAWRERRIKGRMRYADAMIAARARRMEDSDG